jgi:plasmid stability protein
MADLNLRNVSEELIRGLKIEAAERGVTMREVAVERLTGASRGRGNGKGSKDRSAAVPGAGGEVGTARGRKRNAAVDVEGRGGAAKAGGSAVAKAEKRVGVCEHGAAKGSYCGFCFGPAKIKGDS